MCLSPYVYEAEPTLIKSVNLWHCQEKMRKMRREMRSQEGCMLPVILRVAFIMATCASLDS